MPAWWWPFPPAPPTLEDLLLTVLKNQETIMAKVDELKSALDEVGAKLDAVSTEVGTITTEVTAVATEVDSLITKLDGLGPNPDMTAVAAAVDQAKGLSERLSKVATDLAAVDTALKAIPPEPA